MNKIIITPWRQELKFLIPKNKVHNIVALLSAHLNTTALESGDVSTLYFDLPGDPCFFGKIGGDANKTKLRLRDYGNPKESWLEIKQKEDNVGRKIRSACSSNDWRESYDHLNASSYGLPAINSPWRESVFIKYHRQSWANDSIRLTLDQNFYFARNNHDYCPWWQDMAIIEIKAKVINSRAYQILNLYGYSPQAISKFAMAYSLIRGHVQSPITLGEA